MNPKMKKLSFALAQVVGVGVALTVVSVPARAQAQSAQTKERIEVTGSNIKRIEGETSQPVTVITRDDIDKTGAVTVEQLLTTIGAVSNFGTLTAAAASGASTGGISTISLRGLGGNRTLVLINGKRISAYGSLNDSVTVDVNSIPLAVVERIEVLKDGASAVYGSDAIAGVINFILRKDYRGAEVTLEYGAPEQSGGGSIARATGVVGVGDLSTDRYNVMLTGTYQKEKSLFGRDRKFASSAVNVADGNDGTSGNTFPGNIVLPDGRTFNPMQGNCAPSISDPLNNPNTRCRFDPSPFVTLIPDTKRGNVLLAGHMAFTRSMEGYAEASWGKQEQRFIIQPVPISDQFALPPNHPLYNVSPYNGFSTVLSRPSSPFYPTAYVRTIIGATAPLPDLIVRYRNFATGLRDLTDIAENARLSFGVKGDMVGWDYDVGYLYSGAKLTERVNGGYPLLTRLLPLLNSGTVNLFGSNTPAVQTQLDGTNFFGDAYKNETSLQSIQAKASKELMQMRAGPLAIAFGGEFRKEDFKSTPDATIQTGDVSGYGGNFLPIDKTRDVTAFFGELNFPITRTLEANAAVRYDNYEGSGSKTTPKVGIRWQASPGFLIRASYGRGFRAPSLTDLYAPNTTGASAAIDDPVRCPVTNNSNDCGSQFPLLLGGNPNLKPENSENYSAGFIFEPNNNFSFGMDFFKIKLKDTIIYGLSEDTILGDLAQFGNLVTRAAPDAANPSLPGRIIQIDRTNLNLGETRLQGVDIDAKYRTASQPWGRITVSFSGTYYDKYDAQNLDGSFTSQVGTVAALIGGAATPRWKHYAAVIYTRSAWDFMLAQSYQAGYHDLPANLTGKDRDVAPYEIFDAQASYSGMRHLKFTLGVKNLLDRDPPYTNAPAYLNSFQSGYDPSYADPRGRYWYGRVTWSFK
jgi:iron complex outermembrane receptor protein